MKKRTNNPRDAVMDKLNRDKVLRHGIERAVTNKTIVVLYQDEGRWFLDDYASHKHGANLETTRYILPQGEVLKFS